MWTTETIKDMRKESKKRSEGGVMHKSEKKRAQKPERSVITDKSELCVVKRKENFSNL
jgi:hypothetical protein